MLCPREIREHQLGLTPEQFAERFMISIPSQQQIERGQYDPHERTEILALYYLIQQSPETVYRSLHGHAMPATV